MQGADHVWFGDVVTGVQGQNQEGDTSDRLSGSRISEPCGDGAEIRLHDQSDGDDKKEEDATLEM